MRSSQMDGKTLRRGRVYSCIRRAGGSVTSSPAEHDIPRRALQEEHVTAIKISEWHFLIALLQVFIVYVLTAPTGNGASPEGV